MRRARNAALLALVCVIVLAALCAEAGLLAGLT